MSLKETRLRKGSHQYPRPGWREIYRKSGFPQQIWLVKSNDFPVLVVPFFSISVDSIISLIEMGSHYIIYIYMKYISYIYSPMIHGEISIAFPWHPPFSFQPARGPVASYGHFLGRYHDHQQQQEQQDGGLLRVRAPERLIHLSMYHSFIYSFIPYQCNSLQFMSIHVTSFQCRFIRSSI